MDFSNWWKDKEQLDLFARRIQAAGIDRRAFLAVMAAASAGMITAACGAPASPTAATVARPTEVPKPTAGATAAPAAASPAAKPTEVVKPAAGAGLPADAAPEKDQVLRTAWFTEPAHMDSNKADYGNAWGHLFATLTRFDPDFKVVPEMAEKWEVSPDGATWTFTMRDTKWSNGQPVTAKDYEWSFLRQLDPATGSAYASFFFDIKGAEAFNTGKMKDPSEVGIKARDDKTLVITLTGPRAYLPALLAFGTSVPAYRPHVEQFGDGWTDPAKVGGPIVTNGGLTLTKWDHNKGWVAERNPGYYAPYKLSRVEVKIIPYSGMLLAYENDEIDFLGDRVQLGDLKRVQGDPKLAKELVKYATPATWYLVPSVKHPPFDNLMVRRALGHAIDREKIASTVLQGVAAPAYTFIMPGLPGYNPDRLDEYTRFDPKKALELLKGTPYEGGKNWPKITLTQREEGDGPKAAGQAIIQMLKEHLGMPIEHEIGESKSVYQRMFNLDVQLMWVRWYADYPDPNNMHFMVFYSNRTSGKRQAWSNPEFDKLVADAAGELNEQKRWAMYAKADEIIAKDAAAIFVYYIQGYTLLKSYVKGWPLNKDGFFPGTMFREYFRDVYIAKK
jgi:ABC-type oligopeptide transport system substrate-binding subunit